MCAALASIGLRNKGGNNGKGGNNKIAPLEPKYGQGVSFLHSKFEGWNNVLLNVNNRLVDGQANDNIDEDTASNATKRVRKSKHSINCFSKQMTFQLDEQERSKWTPREEKPTKEHLACAVAILVTFFLIIIFGFIVVIGGYELFCFTFLETKAFINALNATNATCPNNPDKLAIPIKP